MPDDAYLTELRGNMQRNSKFASPGPYASVLQPKEEKAFREWVAKNNVPFNPQDTVADYDMRGFWKALQMGDPRAASSVNQNDNKIHYPDIWKTPYHNTFSADSQWAMPGAPKWFGNQLVMPNGQVIFDETKK